MYYRRCSKVSDELPLYLPSNALRERGYSKIRHHSAKAVAAIEYLCLRYYPRGGRVEK